MPWGFRWLADVRAALKAWLAATGENRGLRSESTGSGETSNVWLRLAQTAMVVGLIIASLAITTSAAAFARRCIPASWRYAVDSL